MPTLPWPMRSKSVRVEGRLRDDPVEGARQAASARGAATAAASATTSAAAASAAFQRLELWASDIHV